jgi:ribosomal protein L11 methyltransferase
MLELFPDGFEEGQADAAVELTAYTDADGETRLRQAFEIVESLAVAPDWAERWREFHRPVRAGPFWIGPPWEAPPADALAIVIDPGRAFGTGAHATTRLCVELLATVEPGALLDVGCGSGVLAIAGAMLGFDPVVAIDVDPLAVDAARENAVRNNVTLDVRQADALAVSLPAAHAVVVNLTLTDVEALVAPLTAGVLIASGYVAADDPALPGWKRRTHRTADGWAADVFERLP